MKLSSIGSLAALASTGLAQDASSTSSSPLAEYTIQADNITATFIPYGARLTSLLVPDRNGEMQDVAVGYDNGSAYVHDSETIHTFFGAVVGRYANRIKNGTFSIDGNTYQIPTNDNDGLDTLHGGLIGYDQRNWTVVTHNESSISFSLLDPGYENFPGTVMNTATYSLSSFPSGPQGQLRPRMTTKLVSIALDQKTPIMLSNHIYWALNAFQAETALNDTTLWMPYSDRYIQTDGILIPNGTFGLTADHPGLDFQQPKLLGTAISETEGNDYCGTNCTGVDNAFALTRPDGVSETAVIPVFHAWSNATGIQMDVSTNQIGLQIYTCNGLNGSVPVTQAQQERNQNVQGAATSVNKHGCFVLETQVYIDGINNPQWGVNNMEIFGPDSSPAYNFAQYDFSTF